MKKTILLALAALLPFAQPTRAITVWDPGLASLTQANHLKEITQFLEMVGNQVEQLKTLQSQLEQVTEYVDRFGDPESLLDITGVDQLLDDLKFEGLGKNTTELRKSASGESAINYDGGGIYKKVPQKTESEVKVTRNPDNYKQYAAVHEAAKNFATVHDDVQERRTELKKTIGETTTALEASTTDAETQKLTGVLVAQSAQLQAIDRELQFATYQVVLQDIENRNEEARQSQATLEEHAADKQDAMKKLKSLVTPDNEAGLKFGKSK